MAQSDLLLRVEGLKTYFHSREGVIKAVDGVNFNVGMGECLGIAGESGCGKSVTAQSILRIVPKSGRIVDGRILFNVDYDNCVDLTTLNPSGKEIRAIRGRKISMIFQEPMTSFSPVLTIARQITEVIMIHQQVSYPTAREMALEILARVGMPEPSQIIDSYPFNLSGGMRQRAMIAMALSCQPSLLIADEPTTAVDVTIQALVLKLIKDLQQDYAMSLMIITHDLGVIAELADRVMIMYLGKDVESTSVEALFYAAKHPYTKGLLASIPKLGGGSKRRRKRVTPIPGTVPNVYHMPAGCSFHTRCPEMVAGLCERETPASYQVTEDHRVSCFLYR